MKQRNIIKDKPLNFNVGLQKWYVKELLKLVDDLTKEVYNSAFIRTNTSRHPER